MAGGTRMTLHRYSQATLDWNVVEVIVDQDFIDTHGQIIPIPYGFEVGAGLLEVFLRGDLILSGVGYTELDSAIELIGQGSTLEVGDEIYIKVYVNQYCKRGGGMVSSKDFFDLKKEVHDARTFKDTDTPYPSLDSRLDYIQKSIELIESGMANVDIDYEHNDKGQITKQIITGEYNLTRDFTFNEILEIEQEVITYGDVVVVKDNTYDLETRRLLKTRVRVS